MAKQKINEAIGGSILATMASAANFANTKLMEKATIYISDRRIDLEKLGVAIPKNPVSAGVAAMPKLSVPGGALTEGLAKKMASEAAEVAKNQAAKAVENITPAALKNLEYNREFTVLFNPSSLNINGFSGGSYDMLDFSGTKDKSAKATAPHTTLTLSVTLIFDQMELATSFPMDSIDFSISNAAMSAIKAVTETIGSMQMTVQAATEGFIGALSNQYTRLMMFSWGQLSYKGVLKNVNANYKMFDVYGRPVRSEVSLTMYLAEKEIEVNGGQANLGQWERSYDDAFSDATKFGASGMDKFKKATELFLGN